ncbi:MAG: molybdate ABC transporter substrate-binding protein [Desulfitobacteriia bacterium]
MEKHKRSILKSLVLVLLFLSAAGLVLTGCGSAAGESGSESGTEEKELIVSAAASLKGALTEIKALYEKENEGLILTYNFASSGSLQQQIEQGAPADIFLSAGKSQMDALEKKGLLAEGTRIDLLANELVLITHKNNQDLKSFEDLKKLSRISIGTPESTPVGKYAQEALKSMNLWSSLEDKIIFAKDVTQILTYVESENVEAGILYKSDVQDSEKARIVVSAPADSHSPIVYPAAVLASSANPAEAQDFLNYLGGEEAKAVFAKYGFKVQ